MRTWAHGLSGEFHMALFLFVLGVENVFFWRVGWIFLLLSIASTLAGFGISFSFSVHVYLCMELKFFFSFLFLRFDLKIDTLPYLIATYLFILLDQCFLVFYGTPHIYG